MKVRGMTRVMAMVPLMLQACAPRQRAAARSPDDVASQCTRRAPPKAQRLRSAFGVDHRREVSQNASAKLSKRPRGAAGAPEVTPRASQDGSRAPKALKHDK